MQADKHKQAVAKRCLHCLGNGQINTLFCGRDTQATCINVSDDEICEQREVISIFLRRKCVALLGGFKTYLELWDGG